MRDQVVKLFPSVFFFVELGVYHAMIRIAFLKASRAISHVNVICKTFNELFCLEKI